MFLLEDAELELVAGGGNIILDIVIGWGATKLLDAAYDSIKGNIGGVGESDPSAMYAGQVTA